MANVRLMLGGGLMLLLAGCETTPDWPESTPLQCRVRNASVDVSCQVRTDGSVESCSVVQETPPGCGFGESALEAAQSTRLRRSSRDGSASETISVRFTIRFRMSPGGAIDPEPPSA